MLRTYGYGNERDFRWQDYLENYVNEATSKRKGENEATLSENSIENHFDPHFFLNFSSAVCRCLWKLPSIAPWGRKELFTQKRTNRLSGFMVSSRTRITFTSFLSSADEG